MRPDRLLLCVDQVKFAFEERASSVTQHLQFGTACYNFPETSFTNNDDTTLEEEIELAEWSWRDGV